MRANLKFSTCDFISEIMAYAKDFEDDISILSMPQVENSNMNFSHVMEKESSAASIYALQIALKDMKVKCDSLEQKNSKYQQSKNRLIGELNEMKQTNNKWLKEIIEKDVTCTQLRQKMSAMSLELARLYDHVDELSKEKAYLQRNLFEVTEENQDLKKKQIVGLNDYLEKDNQIMNDSKPNHYKIEKELCSTNSPLKQSNSNFDASETKHSGSWQDLSQKLLMEMKQEMIQCEDYSKLLSVNVTKSKTDGYPDEYHSHHKLPDAPCACVLAPCAVAVDNDASIDTVISECCDIKEELVAHTESLRSTCAALKAVLRNKSRHPQDVSSEDAQNSLPKLDSEHNFVSNIATYNSEVNHPDSVSLQPTESIDQIGNENQDPQIHPAAQYQSSSGEITLDRVCPICEAVYPALIPFNEYESHVLSHFDHEGDEISRNFEFV